MLELHTILDKSFTGTSITEALDAPVSVLKGLSESDAKHLATALNIRTVRDLATNKFFLHAQEILKEWELTHSH